MVEEKETLRIRIVIIDYNDGCFIYYQPVGIYYWAVNQMQNIGSNRDLAITVDEQVIQLTDLQYQKNEIIIERIAIEDRYKRLVNKVNSALKKMEFLGFGHSFGKDFNDIPLRRKVGKRIFRYLKKICELENKEKGVRN